MFPEQKAQCYRFDDFTVDTARRVLLRDDRPVPLNPKAFDLLIALIESRGQVLTKDELLDRVWPDQFVEEGNLTVHMSAVRKALGERKREPRFVVTLPGRGYRFVAHVGEPDGSVVIEQHTLSRIVVEQEEGSDNGTFDATITKPPAATRSSIVALVNDAAQPELAIGSSSALQPQPEVEVSLLKRRRWVRASIAAAVLFGLLIASTFAYRLYNQRQNQHAGDVPNGGGQGMTSKQSASKDSLRQMTIRRVTSNGRVKEAAVSADGKYVAYILSDVAGDSIHLTEVGTSSDVRVLPSEDSTLSAIMFAPDGDSLYFYRQRKQESSYYNMPVLGGAPERVLPGINSAITFSPDRNRVAFIRTYPDRGEPALMLANLNGGDEQVLAWLSLPFISSGLAWSPDGSVIAIGVHDDQKHYYSLLGVQVADGTSRPISTKEWCWIGKPIWLGDGTALVMEASDKEMCDSEQVWMVSYPRGEARRITNDILRYADNISLSASSNELLAVASRIVTNIWVGPATNPGEAKQITFGTEEKFDGLYGLGWTPDFKLIYGSYIGYSQTIWTMNADGDDQKQLTPTGYVESALRVTGDGRYIVFHSNRSGSFNIWRADIDGSNALQLTTGVVNLMPAVSPDGEWVIYRSWQDKKGTLWKVSIDGGTPAQLTNKPYSAPSIAPDGRFIACVSGGKLVVIPFTGGEPVKTFPWPRTATVGIGIVWSPDASALLYCDAVQGIWKQSLAGGKPEKQSGLRSERVFDFAFSPDGQKLAITYGTESSDAVLISAFR